MSHTPGEWWYNERTESIGCPSGWIGRVQHTQKADPPFGNPDDDGRLMAAAPNLLAACKKGRDFLYNLPSQDAFFLSLSPQLREFFKEATEGIQAAIAKAEGDE